MLRPLRLEHLAEVPAQLGRHGNRLAGFVQGDRPTDIVHNDLARIAVGQVRPNRVANRRINLAVNEFVQYTQQVVAVHGSVPALFLGSKGWMRRTGQQLQEVGSIQHVVAERQHAVQAFSFGGAAAPAAEAMLQVIVPQ